MLHFQYAHLYALEMEAMPTIRYWWILLKKSVLVSVEKVRAEDCNPYFERRIPSSDFA